MTENSNPTAQPEPSTALAAPARESALVPPGESSEALEAVPTRATRVIFFEDRAEVVRAARLSLPEGLSWVALRGVTPYLDDRSIQARVLEGEAKVVSARVRRRTSYETALSTDALRALEQEEAEAEKALRALDNRLERARARLRHLEQLFAGWASPLASVPRGAGEEGVIDQWRAAYRSLEEALSATQREITEARAEEERHKDALLRAQLRLQEGRKKEPRFVALIEVQLSLPGPAEIALEVTYRTPCALWRPEHLARLIPDPQEEKKGEIEIQTFATAWQCTGERWEDIEAVFSTARPAREASPPRLSDDLLTLRRKTDEERRQVIIEAREQAVATAGLNQGSRQVEEMPGVDDGGTPLSFSSRSKVTIESNGQPFRVEVARVRVPAEVGRVLYPEKSPVAHLRAISTLTGEHPLLAGPVRLARGAGLIGRAQLSFVGKGEPFELGFGPDDGIRVRRLVQEERDTVPVLGRQKRKRTVEIFLSNLSGEKKEVEVTERIPISEIEDVEISLLNLGGFQYDAKDGFARLPVTLSPHENRKLTLSYEVRAAAKVRLPF